MQKVLRLLRTQQNIMVDVEIKVFGREKAEKVIEKLRFRGCKIKNLSVSEDWKEPITLTAVCYSEEVVDEVLREIKDPDIFKKILPDELTPYPRWEIRKNRRIF